MVTSEEISGSPDGSNGNMSNLSIGFKLTSKKVYTTWMFAMTTLLSVERTLATKGGKKCDFGLIDQNDG